MNEGFLPQDNKDPPNQKVPLGGQVSINLPVLTDWEIREEFLNFTQFMDIKLKL